MKRGRVRFIAALMLALSSALAPIVAIRASDGSESASADSRLRHIPDRGAVLYYQAVIKQHHGATSEALQLLRQCLRLHEGFDPSGSPAFAALLKDSPAFAALLSDVHRDFPSVGRARLAFVTEEQDLVPEGLAYDPRQDALYLSSLNRRKIVKIDANGIVSDFVPDGRDNLLPVLIGIQNAIGSPRIVAWRLSKDASRVTHTTVLEYRSALLTGEPTTGAIKGDDFYFIINSQGENMEGDHVAVPSKLERVRIGVVRLPD